MTTTPEPLLEMTEADRVLLRSIYRPAPDDVGVQDVIDILLRIEAGRRQVIFETVHRLHDVTRECLGCGSTDDPRHNWTPADWLAEVEREVGKERC